MRGRNIIELLLNEHFAAHQPGIKDPPHHADCDVHVDEARTEHRHDRDDDHQKGKGQNEIDDPSKHEIQPTTEIAGDKPDKRADKQGSSRREYGDLHVDACRIDRPRKNVAAEIIGAERMRQARRLP